METLILYLILLGWALMLMLRRLVSALVVAAVVGLFAGYLVFLGNESEANLVLTMGLVTPTTAMVVAAVWPVGVFCRRLLRRRRNSLY